MTFLAVWHSRLRRLWPCGTQGNDVPDLVALEAVALSDRVPPVATVLLTLCPAGALRLAARTGPAPPARCSPQDAASRPAEPVPGPV